MIKKIKKILILVLATLILMGSAANGIETPSDLTNEEPVSMVSETPPIKATDPPKATNTPATLDLLATIVWKDNNNANSIRPNAITIVATGSDGNKYSGEAREDSQNVESSSNVWTLKFSNLPKMIGDTKIEYQITTSAPEGYFLQIDGSTLYLILKEPESPTEIIETPVAITEFPDEVTPTPQVETSVEELPIKVVIFSSRRAVMEAGETVYLTSKIEGAEGYEILFQWQCDKGDGFEDVPGANESQYSFEASIETLSYNWRLVIYYRFGRK